MKEATGELSTTVIAIVAIAAILTIFTLILPRLKNSISAKSMCASATCLRSDCGEAATCTCTYIEMTTNDSGTVETNDVEVTCPNPYIDNSQVDNSQE